MKVDPKDSFWDKPATHFEPLQLLKAGTNSGDHDTNDTDATRAAVVTLRSYMTCWCKVVLSSKESHMLP